MDNERRKYFKDMINKCTSEVKWKKKEALQKTKTNLDKENSKVFSTKIENQYTVCTSNQEVTVADVHQDPSLNIKKCNDQIDTETSLKTQNCEITIELEEVEADKNEINLYNEQDSEDIIPHAKSEFTETIQIIESEYFSQSKYNKIMTRRYNDLKKLCETGVIPKILHREYLSLPYRNGKDVLIDTDIEDSENEENE